MQSTAIVGPLRPAEQQDASLGPTQRHPPQHDAVNTPVASVPTRQAGAMLIPANGIAVASSEQTNVLRHEEKRIY